MLCHATETHYPRALRPTGSNKLLPTPPRARTSLYAEHAAAAAATRVNDNTVKSFRSPGGPPTDVVSAKTRTPPLCMWYRIRLQNWALHLPP